ncbi:MAG: FAD-dependent oxidoreductase, partial [Muribaculaceae bacterium]|nr:FAD-dependent oxidoreductase [Muribaculaceae bacterium]
ARLASRGSSGALVERDMPGGTCLNRGCIPTKCLCATAAKLLTLRKAAAMGVAVDGTARVDYPAALGRMHGVVDELRAGVESLLRGVELVRGEARFLPDGSVEAAGRVLSADKILIATGSRPALLPVEGAEYAVTSDDILERDVPLPARLTLIGAGVIGIEFASIFSAMGVDVTVVEYCKEILPTFDADVAKRLRMALQGRGVSFVLGASVQRIGADRTVHYAGKKGPAAVAGDMVLMAVGRRPVVPEGVRDAGIELTDRGFVAG